MKEQFQNLYKQWKAKEKELKEERPDELEWDDSLTKTLNSSSQFKVLAATGTVGALVGAVGGTGTLLGAVGGALAGTGIAGAVAMYAAMFTGAGLGVVGAVEAVRYIVFKKFN